MKSEPKSNVYKYNPGFLDDDELVEHFVARKAELAILLDIIRENEKSSSNRHVLLVGPRGAGKTTLTRRIAAELRLDSGLEKSWHPISFGEESYAITSVGEFWLECVFHLFQSLDSKELEAQYQRLRQISDEKLLSEAALGVLVDQAQQQDKRFILFVENVNMLLGDQMSSDDAWSFRHALQNRPEVMLMATSTSSFDQIENDDQALFEQFKIHHVEALTKSDCKLLWSSISGEDLDDHMVRPIQILTGGNPRLIRILAEFALDTIFHQLVDKLSFVIDQYTDYFKSQLDILPVTERKVFVTLLELWDPATTGTVAKAARISSNKTGALLGRLVNRGAVVKDQNHWQTTDRLFNIYYLMRRRGAPTSRVQALVRFMTVYYQPDQLVTRVQQLASEACDLEPSLRKDHYYAVSELLGQLPEDKHRSILDSFPEEFLSAPASEYLLPNVSADAAKEFLQPADHDNSSQSNTNALFGTQEGYQELAKLIENKQISEARDKLLEFMDDGDQSVFSYHLMSVLTGIEGDEQEAMRWSVKSLDERPDFVPALSLYCKQLFIADKTKDAFEIAKRLVDASPEVAEHWQLFAEIADELKLDISLRRDALEKVLALEANNAEALNLLARVFEEEQNFKEAKVLYEKSISTDQSDISHFGEYGDFLANKLEAMDEAQSVFEQLIERFPDDPRSWSRLAHHYLDQRIEWKKIPDLLTKSLEIDPEHMMGLVGFAHFYEYENDIENAKQTWTRLSELFGDEAVIWSDIARLNLMIEDYPESETAALKAVELAPNNSSHWNQLGAILMVGSNRTKEAESAFRKAVEISPGKCSAKFNLGQFYDSQGDTEQAAEQYQSALKDNGNCSCSIERLLSDKHDYGRKINNSAQLVEGLLEKFPESSRAHMLNARYQYHVNNNIEQARLSILDALNINDGDDMLWKLAAEVLFLVNDPQKSETNELLELIRKFEPCEHILNAISWHLHKLFGERSSSLSIQIARLAMDKDSEDWDLVHTLAAVLVDGNEPDEALQRIEWLLEKTEYSQY